MQKNICLIFLIKFLLGDFFMINSPEILADNVLQKLEQVLNERKFLRKELSRKSSGSMELDKAFVMIFRNNILDIASASMNAVKLEHMLMMR